MAPNDIPDWPSIKQGDELHPVPLGVIDVVTKGDEPVGDHAHSADLREEEERVCRSDHAEPQSKRQSL